MAKKNKLVDKVLDKTNLDEKLVEKYNENPGLYNKIWCYTKCFGGYLVAVGAGCTFGANFWVGLGMLAVAGIWAWKVRNCKPCCKGGVCESK